MFRDRPKYLHRPYMLKGRFGGLPATNDNLTLNSSYTDLSDPSRADAHAIRIDFRPRG